jgi:hypothetical protein
MAINPTASLAGLSGPSSSSNPGPAPKDAEENKNWAKKMFEAQFWDRQKAMYDKQIKQLEGAMKGKGGGFTPL